MKLMKLIDLCIDTFIPAKCPVCRLDTTSYSSAICENCLKSLFSEIALTSVSSEYIFNIWSCRAYTGIMKKSIVKLKYYGKKNIIWSFKKILQDYLIKNSTICNDMDIIIPVPLSVERYKKRGYNQSELIADMLSSLIKIPVLSKNLIKTKNTPTQIGLSRPERLKNLLGSFSVLRSRLLSCRNILLVDDVITTGATIDSCAIELLRAGAKKIHGFTLARTL